MNMYFKADEKQSDVRFTKQEIGEIGIFLPNLTSQ